MAPIISLSAFMAPTVSPSVLLAPIISWGCLPMLAVWIPESHSAAEPPSPSMLPSSLWFIFVRCRCLLSSQHRQHFFCRHGCSASVHALLSCMSSNAQYTMPPVRTLIWMRAQPAPMFPTVQLYQAPSALAPSHKATVLVKKSISTPNKASAHCPYPLFTHACASA